MDALRLWILPVASAIAVFVLLYRPIPTKKPNEDCSLLPHDHFWIYSKRVVTPNGVISGGVEIKGGRILSVVEEHGKFSNNHAVDYGEAVIMPGLIDVHAHLDDPGRAEWEGFPTGTKAAAAGGITMLVDMPLNSDPSTTTVEALKLKVDVAKGNIYIDVGFWGGLVPENAFNLTSLEGLLEAGVLGLKEALHILSKYRRPLLVHAEIELDSSNRKELGNNLDDFQSYSTYLKTRPPSWEQAAIGELSKVAEDTKPGARSEGAHLHIVHLSDASISLDLIKEAKNDGRSISVETCPHYLAFSAEEIQDGDTRFKCAPPIRDAANRQFLWKALKEGYIDMLSSDHSPTVPERKLLDEGDFLRSWGGISSLQFVLPVTWSFGQEHGITLQQLSSWWSERPAELASQKSKGTIEKGKDADIVVWDPDSAFEIDENFTIYHKHPITPYAGRRLSGKVLATFVRGNLVYNDGLHAPAACGVPIFAT
ncbi:Allantoinase [Nymphaea thermarum]|nr:Allantoinase [Nymphaea thermarum]